MILCGRLYGRPIENFGVSFSSGYFTIAKITRIPTYYLVLHSSSKAQIQ